MISYVGVEEVLAQFVVRNLEETVKARLRRRAQRHGRSMEEEVREILRSAVHEEETPAVGLGTRIAALFAKKGLVSDIPELRGHFIKPPTFEP
jgi:plasmid stability protein